MNKWELQLNIVYNTKEEKKTIQFNQNPKSPQDPRLCSIEFFNKKIHPTNKIKLKFYSILYVYLSINYIIKEVI
jgi:hypothetical protein